MQNGMKLKTILLTLVLSTGISFQRCSVVEDACDCGDFFGEFFDVRGMELIHFRQTDASVQIIGQGEEVPFSSYSGLNINFIVDYIGHASPKSHGFSLINTAMACTCVPNGIAGSRDEVLTNLVITTINDYDENHLAGDTINDLHARLFHLVC